MKYIKWKILIITCLVCLLPIILGLALWNNLPDRIAIHFDLNNNPDNFATKGFAVFGLPFLMIAFQCFGCFINDINVRKQGDCIKGERVTKWIIPVISVIIQCLIFGYALGWKVDMRVAAMLVVGGLFVVTGSCLPEIEHIKNYHIDAGKARKINRFLGVETVIMGLLFIISTLFPPSLSVVCLFLLIPYTLIGVIYGVKVGKNKKS